MSMFRPSKEDELPLDKEFIIFLKAHPEIIKALKQYNITHSKEAAFDLGKAFEGEDAAYKKFQGLFPQAASLLKRLDNIGPKERDFIEYLKDPYNSETLHNLSNAVALMTPDGAIEKFGKIFDKSPQLVQLAIDEIELENEPGSPKKQTLKLSTLERAFVEYLKEPFNENTLAGLRDAFALMKPDGTLEKNKDILGKIPLVIATAKEEMLLETKDTADLTKKNR